QVAVTLQPLTVIIQSRLPTLIGAAEGISGQTVLKPQGVRQVMASGIVSCILQQGCLVPVVAVLCALVIRITGPYGGRAEPEHHCCDQQPAADHAFPPLTSLPA